MKAENLDTGADESAQQFFVSEQFKEPRKKLKSSG